MAGGNLGVTLVGVVCGWCAFVLKENTFTVGVLFWGLESCCLDTFRTFFALWQGPTVPTYSKACFEGFDHF